MQIVKSELRPEVAPYERSSLPHGRIAELPLFARLPEEVVAGILKRAQKYSLKREEFLYRRGDLADYFYVLLSGRILLSFPGQNGQQTIIDIVNPNELFSENAIFSGEAQILDAYALEDSEIVAISAAEFRQELDRNFHLVEGLIAILCTRMREMVDQLSELKGKTTAQRVGGFMLQLTDAKHGSVVVRLPYEKRLVAGRLGMKPESLSRALTKIRQYGVREREDVFVIDDIERLKNFCEGTGGDE